MRTIDLGVTSRRLLPVFASVMLAVAPALADPEAKAPDTPAAQPSETAAPAPAKADATETHDAAPAGEAKQLDDAAAKPAEPAPAPAAQAQPAAPVTDPVLDAIRAKLTDKSVLAKADSDDVAALVAFYAARSAPLWVKDGAFTSQAASLIAEMKKADDWGLEATAFVVPELATAAPPAAQGEAEVRLGLAALKYARFARGGRFDPVSLSNILDMKPPLKDPKTVLAQLSESSTPDAYLRGLNPKHPEFEKLRQALLKMRGPKPPEEKIDEALLVKMPDGGNLKPGADHPDIALLRKRLKIATEPGANETVYDSKLEEAVRAFQEDKGLKSNGIVNSRTRTALNREGEPKKIDSNGKIDLILVNMERWRWLPENMGGFYVINNIPEFVSRVMKDGEEVFKQKIIVGQPTWPTPVLTASMEFVIFHPEWGVPDGIKVKELLPRLKRASAQYGGFFDQIFGGGSSGGGRVLEAYKLTPSLNGRPVDANSIDWNTVDIRRFSFVQPAGSENPLGFVKFRFPNRHDVYMHDTPQRNLFAQSYRALSHGCMRVDQPLKFAELLLAEDKGWSADKVSSMMSSSTNDITLTTPVPVYLTYFTARADADGNLQTFADLYGHDSRVLSAMNGRIIRYVAPEGGSDASSDATAYDPPDDPVAAPASGKKSKKADAKAARGKKGSEKTAGDILTNAMSGLLAN